MGGFEELIARNGAGGSLVALIVLAVLAVWRGWLVPLVTVTKLTEATAKVELVQAQRLADSMAREETWRAAWAVERARGDLQSDQIGELLELARLDHAVLTALRTATGGSATG